VERALISLGGTKIPSTPPLIISGIPPTFVSITGTLAEKASKMTNPKGSNSEGKTKI